MTNKERAHEIVREWVEPAEEWLRAHPRGHIELTATDDGFIATRSRIDTDTGEVAEDAATGWGNTINNALAACTQEGE